MIELDVMDRCHGCPEFQAKQIGPQIVWAEEKPCIVGDVIIRCERESTCRYIEEYLKRRETT